MDIKKERSDAHLTISLTGRLDTITAPDLEQELRQCLDGVETLTLDLAGLDYISSAGLRVLVFTQKTMSKRGGMKLTHVGKAVMEILDVTRLNQVLKIE